MYVVFFIVTAYLEIPVKSNTTDLHKIATKIRTETSL